MPLGVSGYVLAGGKSSRMGRNKALLELAGKPLVAVAVDKLKAVCHDVYILSSESELGQYGTLVSDVHPGCGPLGGIEAALLHASCEWSLMLPVDMPFLHVEFLQEWLRRIAFSPTARVALFTIGDKPQPTLCLLRREVLPFIQSALEDGRYKLYPTLEEAGRRLARESGLQFEEVFLNRIFPDEPMFANLNTPEEFSEAARNHPRGAAG
jgi:molybdopterin-guanine dinucleotide biosynthesis protein A